jgi:predicted acylesterase/phospholipase RssA
MSVVLNQGRPTGCGVRHAGLLAVVLLVAACATVEPPPSHPTARAKGPAAGVASRWAFTLGPQEWQDRQFVGLALSGGGSRAAVFGAAVMLELDRLGVLQHVDAISAVSGGAMPAALYALDGRNAVPFRDEVLGRVGYDFQGAILRRWATPWQVVRSWFSDDARPGIVIDLLDRELFHGATYGDLNPDRPKLLLNATNALTGEPIVLSDEVFAALNRAPAAFPVSRAVYMSASYPGLFPPLMLAPAGEAGGNGVGPGLTAYDGGTGDNLGIATLLRVLERETVHQPLEAHFPDGCLVIAVDATPRSRRDNDQPLSAAAALLANNRRHLLDRAGIPPADQDRIMFGEFPVGHGSSRCRLWHIALRQLSEDDGFGAQVARTPTNLGLDREDQDRLLVAAARLVERGRQVARTVEQSTGTIEPTNRALPIEQRMLR